MKEKLGITFAILFIIFVMAGAIFVASLGYVRATPSSTQPATNENFSNQYGCTNSSVGEDQNSQLVPSNNFEINKKVGTIIYNIILLDFSDVSIPNINEKTQELKKTYNEISQYFLVLSNNNLVMKFNFYHATLDCVSTDFMSISYTDTKFRTLESNYFETAKQTATLIEAQASLDANCTILQYYSNNEPTENTVGWPHVSYYTEYIMACYNLDCKGISIAHELGHTLNLYDLYSTSSLTDFIPNELMSHQVDFTTPLNAHYKQKLGWLTESTTSDNLETQLEKITGNGTYKIYYPSTPNKTTAYYFSSTLNDGNYFYIEARNNSSLSSNQLVVNRADTTKNKYSNCSAKTYNDCYIATIAYLSEETSDDTINFYGSNDNGKCIYTTSNITLKISIGNVQFFDDYVIFDFAFSPLLDSTTTLKVLNPATNTAISNANIYLNNSYIGSTSTDGTFSYKFSEGDIITILKDCTSVEYTIPELTNQNRNITILFSNTQKINLNIFKAPSTPNTNLVNYFYTQSKTQIFPTVTIKYYDKLIYSGNLLENQYFDIYDNTTILIEYENCDAKTYTFNQNTLSLISDTELTFPTSTQNNTLFFNLCVNEASTIFTLEYTYSSNKYATFTNISAFNTENGVWEKLTSPNSTSSSIPTYVALPNSYTKLKLEVQNYWEFNTLEILEIQKSTLTYSQSLEQNFIQSFFDWWLNLFN